MADIREGIHLFRVGRLDPVLEFHRRVVERFDLIWQDLEQETTMTFEGIDSVNPVLEAVQTKRPSSTWTYLVNDDPFEGKVHSQFLRNIRRVIGKGLKL